MRVSATLLESFRLYREQDWMPEKDLLASIRGEYTPHPNAIVGDAFHKILRSPEKYRVAGRYVANERTFSADDVSLALGVVEPGGVFEVKGTRPYIVDGEPALLVVKADQLLGLRINEHKTDYGTFDFDKRERSIQWRCMAAVFQPSVITYKVFRLDETKREHEYELRAIEQFNLYPYEGLDADVRSAISEFIEYARTRRMLGYLDRHGESSTELLTA